MNSRERFIATVERKPVDRPACWLGDPTPEAVPALCDYYHVDNIKELKKVCGDDFYAVEIPYKSPTCSAIFAAFDWYMNGSNVDTEHRTLTADGCFAQCEDLEDVEAVNFPWPDPELYIDPEECRRLMNMVAEPEMVHYVDDHIVDFYLKALKIFLEATKGKVQAILIGDDVGSQRGLMISPALISEFVIPGAKKLIDLAHSYGVKVVYHSCGSIVEAIPLLIEAGVDVIHPIQALAAGMDPANLKDKFDGKISFCGGVDTQDLLPNGTPEQVAAKVKELRTYFPTGLIVSPSHEGLQPDVPPSNIKALFDEATKIYE